MFFAACCIIRHSLRSVFVLQYLGTGNGMANDCFIFRCMYYLFYSLLSFALKQGFSFQTHELFVVYFSCVASNIFHVEDYCKTICDICCNLKVVYTHIRNFHLLDILNVCKCQHYHRRCTVLPRLFFWEANSSIIKYADQLYL